MHTMFRKVAFILLCVALSVAPVAGAANTWDYPVLDAKDGWVAASWEAAGTVALVDGDAMITALSGEQRKAVAGDSLRQGETITTTDDAEVHIDMEDGGLLSLRPQTRVTVQSYKADGGDDDRSILWLDRGTIRSVTGWIGHNSRSRMQVAILTPNATVGVRGTDHETTYLPPGDARGEPGTYDKVNEGSTVIRNTVRGGTTGAPPAEVVVQRGRAGFHPAEAASGVAARPRVLATVPSFYRPARNDTVFEQRREAQRGRLDALARERLARTDTRRAALGLAPVASARRAVLERSTPAAASRNVVAPLRPSGVAAAPSMPRRESGGLGAAGAERFGGLRAREFGDNTSRNGSMRESGQGLRAGASGGLGLREGARDGGGLRLQPERSSPSQQRGVAGGGASGGVPGGPGRAGPGAAAKGPR